MAVDTDYADKLFVPENDALLLQRRVDPPKKEKRRGSRLNSDAPPV